MSTGELVDEQGHIQIDLPCCRCGYNVRGLHWSGCCPECAALVVHSTSLNRVATAPSARIYSIIAGLWLTNFATVAFIVTLGSGGWSRANIPSVTAAFGWMVGILLTAAREPVVTNDQHARRLRPTACLAALCAFGSAVGAALGLWSGPAADPLVASFGLLAVMGWCTAESATLRIMAGLAELIPSRPISELALWTYRLGLAGIVPFLLFLVWATMREPSGMPTGEITVIATWLKYLVGLIMALWMLFVAAIRLQIALAFFQGHRLPFRAA